METNYAVLSIGKRKGDTVSIKDAVDIVLQGYDAHNFVCGRDRQDRTGKCQLALTLCAVGSTHCHAYFRQSHANDEHTCNNIKSDSHSDETTDKNAAIQYESGQAVLDFPVDGHDNDIKVQKKTNSTEKKSTPRTKTSGASGKRRTVITHTPISVLESIVANRYTRQPLKNSDKQIYLDELFYPIEKIKSDVHIKYPFLKVVWFGTAVLNAYDERDEANNPYVLYRIVFPYQSIDGKPISIFFNEIQIETLLPDYKNLISKFVKNGHSITHLLRVYTTEETTTSNDGHYENIIVDPQQEWKTLKEHILILDYLHH